MHRYFQILLLLLLMIPMSDYGRHTISGYVEDAETGEKLIGAKVFDPVLKAGAVTNAFGFYSLTLETDSVNLACSYIGYEPWGGKFALDKDLSINISLNSIDVNTEGLTITDELDIAQSSEMSTIEVPIEMIKSLPALLGEVDVIKTIQLLPGVQSGNEGSSGLYVRGGGPDQNLILLDGVPVYNVSHLFGFFSVFNADAIKKVKLIKGGYPARYGGRISSVLDISMKDGNMKDYHADGTISLIASKLTVEGPIIKDKTSFIVSARRTYLDALVRPFIALESEGDQDFGYYFYDINAKVNHKFSDKDRLYASLYTGRDKFFVRDESEEISPSGIKYEGTNDFRLNWGNTIAALRWNHLFTNKLFSNLTLTYSDYNFSVDILFEETITDSSGPSTTALSANYDSGIRDYSARLDFDYYPAPNHLVRFGGNAIHHTFTPGVSQFQFNTPVFDLDTTFGSQIVNGLEMALYIEDDMKVGERIKLNAGVHLSGMVVNQRFYKSFQPRFSGRYLFDENWAAKASFATMTQFIHLLTNNNIGLPTDLWVPATDKIRPQQSWQVAGGIARNFRKPGLELSLEGYYKRMWDLITYSEGAAFIDIDDDWQDNVEVGKGWSYGLEGLLQRKRGRTTGWVGYTLSWTERQFDALNEGKPFPYKFDRRHDISVVLSHKFSDRIDAGLTWVYGTGNAVTLPVASYLTPTPNITDPFPFLGQGLYYGDRNAFRMRSYHRMDAGINFHKQRPKWKRTWSLSVYNVYNRKNPFFMFFDDEGPSSPNVLKQVSLFPIIPSIAFRFQF